MRDLNIAYGNSRTAKKWNNKTISFANFKERLKVPVRTSESAEEYAKFSKAQKDAAKDNSGFVAGFLKDGKRKADSVESRSMISLDGDKISMKFLDSFETDIPYTSVLYTTHSCTKDNPRARLVFPLTRDVTPEEYVAVSRYLAQMLGINFFDECSYLPNQMMYWPSASSDGMFVYKETEKEWLNPDDILNAHPEWKDPTVLPVSSKENVAKGISSKKQADPLKKSGVVGLFNRVFYPINLAIDEFLSDIYEPTDNENRYHLITSSSMAGVEIKENGKFVYSHHAKDPAYLKLCNAFDIVRIHKFGDDDNKSFANMCEFAMKQEKIKLRALEERRSQMDEDFTDEKDWQLKLRYMPRSKCLENSVWNLMLILNNDSDFANIVFNDMANRVQITGTVPWTRPDDNKFWRDADTAQMKALIDIRYETFSGRNYDVAFTKVVEDRHFHPLREWLDSLPEWDGTVRLERLYIDYLGAKDTGYVKAVTRKSFVAAVARIYEPGIKFDSVVVLVGPKGCGKSTIFAKMGKEYYSDSLNLMDMKDKSGAEKLQGYWLLELGELAGLKKAEVEVVKAFVSRTDDAYRPSYGRTVESHPRQCVIVGTTNSETGFLRDITGNRRFWPVKVTGETVRKPWDITEDEIIQMWAEAKYLYRQGEALYLNVEENIEALSEQIDAMETDERQGIVEEYLNTLLPDNWNSMDLYERRNFFTDNMAAKGTIQRKTVSNAEIWSECFCRNLSELKPSDSYAIAALMTKVDGWERTNKIKKLPIYGRQRIYNKL